MRRTLALLMACLMIALVAACAPTASNTSAAATTSEVKATSTPAAASTEPAKESTEPAKVTTEPAKETTKANVEYKQSPYLDGKGLPPVAERLPKEPKLTNEIPVDQLTYEIGNFGGTMRFVTSAVEWDADVFVMTNEPLLNTPGILGKEITGNILKGYKASDDQKSFTFFMREGLRWSDGEPVTMEDVRFTVEDFIFNEELTPAFPNWMKAAGKRDGAPFKFEIVDDWTFKITFTESYGGFPMHLAIQGWKGYTEFLKPSHFLKPYHKKYAKSEAALKEFIAPLALKYNFADDAKQWANVFNKVDITNWENTNSASIGFPRLYPWLFNSKTETVATFVRNPYYFKVDTAGNQLPYVDTLQSTLVEDIEMVTLKTIAGEVDFSRESASLIKMPLYRENEAKGGYKALLFNMHVTPTDILINETFKDPTWKLVSQDVRFRKALSLAINRDELIDSIYYGFAEPGKIQDPTYDVAAASALLDEMGMKKGANGMRTAPDGKKFSFLIEVGAEAPDIVPYSELLVEFWRAVGLDASMKRLEQSLVGNKVAANEMQIRVIWTHTPLWYMQDWGFDGIGRSWNVWKTNIKSAEITNKDGSKSTIEVKGEEPPATIKELYALSDSLLQVSIEEAVNVVLPKIKKSMADNYWYIVALENIKQPLIVNAKLGNIPSSNCVAIAADFSGEQFFYKK